MPRACRMRQRMESSSPCLASTSAFTTSRPPSPKRSTAPFGHFASKSPSSHRRRWQSESAHTRPSFEQMESRTDNAIEGGLPSKHFTLRNFSSSEYLSKSRAQRESEKQGGMSWRKTQTNAMIVEGYTELAYSVPDNTTLLNITGPIMSYCSCYAAVNPRPAWWSKLPSFRASVRLSPGDETFFVLPLDPTVKYELAIGSVDSMTDDTPALDKYSNCGITGVTSYSFFW